MENASETDVENASVASSFQYEHADRANNKNTLVTSKSFSPTSSSSESSGQIVLIGDCLSRDEETVFSSENMKKDATSLPHSYGTESLSQHIHSKSNLLTVHLAEKLVVKETQEIPRNSTNDDHDLKGSFVEGTTAASSSYNNTSEKHDSIQNQVGNYMPCNENTPSNLLVSNLQSKPQIIEQSDQDKTPELMHVNFLKNDSGDTLEPNTLQSKESEMIKEKNDTNLIVSVETVVKENKEVQFLCIAQKTCDNNENKFIIAGEHDSSEVTFDTPTINSKDNTSMQPSKHISDSCSDEKQVSYESDLNEKTDTTKSIPTEQDKNVDCTEHTNFSQKSNTSENQKISSALPGCRERLSTHVEELTSKSRKSVNLGLAIKYRDANDEWSCDSESDSDMSSSSSLSDNSDDDKGSALNRDKKTVQMTNGNAKNDDPLKNGDKTKGEIGLDDLPPIEDLHITVPENEMEQIGNVKNIVGQLVVIQSFRNSSALDLDTVLFLSGGNPLGQIFDVFGPVVEPLYAVRFNSVQDIKDKIITTGIPVYCAPSHSDITCFVFTEKLKSLKGSDASWEHNNEPPEDCLDYSNDEEEKQAKQKRKAKRRSRPLDIFKIGQEIKKLRKGSSNASASQMPETKFFHQRPHLRPPSAAMNLMPMSWTTCQPSPPPPPPSPVFSVPPLLPSTSVMPRQSPPVLITSQIPPPPRQSQSPFAYQNGFQGQNSTVMCGTSVPPKSPLPMPRIFSLQHPSPSNPLHPSPCHAFPPSHSAPPPTIHPAVLLRSPHPAIPPPAPCHSVPPPPNPSVPPPLPPCHTSPVPYHASHVLPPSPHHALPPPGPHAINPAPPSHAIPHPSPQHTISPSSNYLPSHNSTSLPLPYHASTPPSHSNPNQVPFSNHSYPSNSHPPSPFHPLTPSSHSLSSKQLPSQRRVLLPTPSADSLNESRALISENKLSLNSDLCLHLAC